MELVIARGALPARPNSAAPTNERAEGSGVIPGPVESPAAVESPATSPSSGRSTATPAPSDASGNP